MRVIHIKKSKITGKIIILTASIMLIYLFVSLYFINHFFFNTVINGVNVSLQAHKDADYLIKSHVQDYKLQLIERDGETETITGQEIGLQYHEQNSNPKIDQMQNPLLWITSLCKSPKYYVEDLYVYHADSLKNKIDQLNCLHKEMIKPQNVSFQYTNGVYEINHEIYGNTIIQDNLNEAIKTSILQGKAKLDLNEALCYENPKYTMKSNKAVKTQNLLNQYVATNVTYQFGSKTEMLDGNIINKWLSVDEDLDVVINKKAITKYVNGLSRIYDTVGAARIFKTSVGKTVEVRGGLYGWKINQEAEGKALLENLEHGEAVEREPIYIQKALPRDSDEIGNTYVEINITRQHLWYYKDGRLITQGAVVTGNPNRGWSTVTGTYMLNYKINDVDLTGPDYEAAVTYWMPFYGNIGIHDASWRYSFGGEIYKRNGTHGCINAPFYLAKEIFENIEDGVPIICYEE